MEFNKIIIELIENSKNAWNERDIEKFIDYFEEDVIAYIEPVSINELFIKKQTIAGKENVMNFLRELSVRLPLRYNLDYDMTQVSKKMSYKKFLYEIKVWAYFECTISEFGKYKEFKITKYENAKSQKISDFEIIKNIAVYKVKHFFGII